MTGIVIDLDGQIERVFPHKFKMTETKAVVETSLSMSASLPLTLIEQVPKGLYQATDWRDGGGQSFGRGATRPPPPLRLQSPLKRQQSILIPKGDMIRFAVQQLFLLKFQPVQGTLLTYTKSSNVIKGRQRHKQGHQETRIQHFKTACRKPTLKIGQRATRIDTTYNAPTNNQSIFPPLLLPLSLSLYLSLSQAS